MWGPKNYNPILHKWTRDCLNSLHLHNHNLPLCEVPPRPPLLFYFYVFLVVHPPSLSRLAKRKKRGSTALLLSTQRTFSRLSRLRSIVGATEKFPPCSYSAGAVTLAKIACFAKWSSVLSHLTRSLRSLVDCFQDTRLFDASGMIVNFSVNSCPFLTFDS